MTRKFDVLDKEIMPGLQLSINHLQKAKGDIGRIVSGMVGEVSHDGMVTKLMDAVLLIEDVMSDVSYLPYGYLRDDEKLISSMEKAR